MLSVAAIAMVSCIGLAQVAGGPGGSAFLALPSLGGNMGFRTPRSQAHVSGVEPAQSGAPSTSSTRSYLPLIGASFFAVVASVVSRDVAMRGNAAPKRQTPHWKKRAQVMRWYAKGNGTAKRALELGRGIKAGTIDFIYGKPQDEDYDDDDEYDDDDFEDDSDDEDALEKKPVG